MGMEKIFFFKENVITKAGSGENSNAIMRDELVDAYTEAFDAFGENNTYILDRNNIFYYPETYTDNVAQYWRD